MKKWILVLLCMALIPVVMAGTITREFSATSIAMGDQVDITYYPDGSAPFVREVVPSGWTVTNSAGGTVTEGVLRVQVAVGTTVTFQAPNADGSYSFTGSYIIDGATDWTTFPIVNVEVGDGGSCPPLWQCGVWSTCVDDEQTRECNDGCGNSRTETQDCDSGNVAVCGNRVCESGETSVNCAVDCGGSSSSDSDICEYFTWAQSISEDNYCTVGIAIVVGGLIILLLLLRK